MGKIERLITIIMILLKKDVVSTREFSQIFNVSKRTILRDMETLSLSNIPIYSVHGVNGGYGIMEEYKVDKRLLNTSDLENILIALGGLEQIFMSEEVELTIKKMEAMVNPLAKQNSIHLSFYKWEGRTEVSKILKTCQKSIAEHKLITFDYIDKNGLSTIRTVEPYQLHFSESSWYLKGFCLQRQGYRTFKLSRIDNLALEEQTFHPRELAPEHAHTSYQDPQITIKAIISPAIQDHFIERYGRESIEIDPAQRLLATIHVPQNTIGFQFLAGFGTNLTIIEPKSYVEEFRHYLLEIAKNYA
ncbi:helix-turn-helix transcriptional regulator [Cytobacillus gottheilii]|uniref:YafY family transcriptional regulator n=1 Tax=Cytobacillus gottheilii TaxID=859144 RepID=A0ABX8FCE1_9BACI|nr:YafY family protein [Cytobacillus gottheilii]QVY61538.1 YafY family transcriptional regulator [Cytobacillus gottheilii]